MIHPLRCSLATLCVTAFAPLAFAGVDLKEEADKVTVNIDGHLFTEYHFTGARRPYLYPIIGPTGGAMTRHWPLQDDLATEEKDHPHHKGLWWGHRNVNGIGFWEDSAKGDGKLGQIVHDSFVEVKSGDDRGSLHDKNKWVVDGTGELVATDERTITFYKGQDGPMIDFDITIKAADKDVVFGDDKDGAMAIRVPETMRVDKPKVKGEKTVPKGDGHIITSEGKKDLEAWGTRGNWCDYYGPVEGKTAGIAMFDNPQNPRHPTWWHVRTYGLFAANPFGQAQFEKLPDKTAGAFQVPAGQSVTFRYRFYFHEGDTDQAKVADHYNDYISPAK
ncbi:MAG: PmoA family protein [Chthoniobacter sp.]